MAEFILKDIQLCYDYAIFQGEINDFLKTVSTKLGSKNDEDLTSKSLSKGKKNNEIGLMLFVLSLKNNFSLVKY